MSKHILPPYWVERISKTYPDRVYYYNTKSGARTWVIPEVNMDMEKGLDIKKQNILKLLERNAKKSKDRKIEEELAHQINCNKVGMELARKKVKMENVQKNKNTEQTCNVKKSNQPIKEKGTKVPLIAKESKFVKLSVNDKTSKKNDINEHNSSKQMSKMEASTKKSSHTPLVRKPVKKKKKNIAAARLKKLQQQLALELEAEEKLAKNNEKLTKNNELLNVTDMVQPTNLYSNYSSRLKHLHQIVKRNTENYIKESYANSLNNEENGIPSSLVKDCCSAVVSEDMDWEPIAEDELLTELQEVRQKVYCLENIVNRLPQNNFALSTTQQQSKHLYIVVDTNVFLIHMQTIKDIMTTQFRDYGRPFIIVPWTVIQELDTIKDSNNKPNNLRIKARIAISFLHEHFSKKHPRVLGQTAEEVNENKQHFNADTPDDLIWQTCLKMKSHNLTVILLTFDKNLQSKAIIHDIQTIGKDWSVEMIEQILHSSENTSYHFLSECKVDAPVTDSILQNEALFVEDVFLNLQELIHLIMEKILSVESKALFGDNWSQHMKIKPPWSASSVLKCAELHWIAITSEAFSTRKALSNVKKLQEIFRKNGGSLKLKDISQLIDIISELIQMINISKYSFLVNESSHKIEVCRNRCIEKEKQINNLTVMRRIGLVQNQQEFLKRAEIGFQLFDHIYGLYRNTIGSWLSQFNLPVPFPIAENKVNFEDYSKEKQIYLMNTLNALLINLKSTLQDIDDQEINVQNIYNLFDSLTSLPVELTIDAIPLDIYCFLRNNRTEVMNGVSQFEDLLKYLNALSNMM